MDIERRDFDPDFSQKNVLQQIRISIDKAARFPLLQTLNEPWLAKNSPSKSNEELICHRRQQRSALVGRFYIEFDIVGFLSAAECFKSVLKISSAITRQLMFAIAQHAYSGWSMNGLRLCWNEYTFVAYPISHQEPNRCLFKWRVKRCL